MNAVNRLPPPLPRPLRLEAVRPAQLQPRLTALGARFQRNRPDNTAVYLAASGHYIRVVPGRGGYNLEFYPAGCAC